MFVGTSLRDAMSIIYINDANTIAKEIKDSVQYESDNINKIVFQPQNIVIRLNNINEFMYLIEKYHSHRMHMTSVPIQDGESDGTLNSKSLMKSLEISKIDVGQISYRDAVEIAIDAYNKLGNKLYGIVFIYKNLPSKKRYLNPFHPIIARTYIESPHLFEIDRAQNVNQIAFYTYNDSIRFTDIHDEDTVKDIAYLVNEFDNLSPLRIVNKNIRTQTTRFGTLTVQYDRKGYNVDGEEIDIENADSSFMVPVQIANISGIAFPYYGTIVAQAGFAFNVSPAYSCNIHSPSIHRNGDTIRGSGVCTHSGQPFTPEGISALNHSNFTSALNSLAFKHNFQEYSQTSMDISAEIYKDALGINTDSDTTPLTKDEFFNIHPDAKVSDYIKYRKEFYANNSQPKNEKYDSTTEEAAIEALSSAASEDNEEAIRREANHRDPEEDVDLLEELADNL